MDGPDGNPIELEHRTRSLAYLDIPGAGQVYVAGDYAFIGHLPNKDYLGTSIIDIRDPKNPRIVSSITLDDHGSHSHKARVIGDVMIVNHERNMTAMGRRAEELPAAELGVEEADIAVLEKAEAEKYRNGGFKVYDLSDRTRPREIAYHRTGAAGRTRRSGCST